MARIEKTVFISYRRTDVYTALAVYENLKNQGYDVFFDYRSISSGDFEQVISSNIRARAHFLLILTPTALDRCNEPGDWLRREIELAIDEKRNIVPLFFKGFRFSGSSPSGISKWLRFGKPEILTGKLGNLTRYNGLNVHEDYFEEGMNRLRIEFLSKPLDTVLHPVSTQVRKVVKEEQDAADEALKHKENAKKPEKTVDEKPDKDAELEELKSQAIRLELKGEFWEALQIYYKIKKLDSSYPRVDVKISELEDELKPKPIARDVVQSAPVGPKPQRTFEWQSMAKVAGIVSLLLLFIWGGSSFYGTLGNNNPQMTQVSQSTGTPTIELGGTGTPTMTPAPPTLGIGSTMTGEDGMTLLYVPAGEFIMGSEDGNDNEKPVHIVYLDAFWIDQTEVTVRMYYLCVEAGTCDEPVETSSATNDIYYGDGKFDNYPVINVNWDMAKTYCEWVDRRLPTEAEWEKAARGTDANIYPWGNSFNGNLLNFCDVNCLFPYGEIYDDGFTDTSPVGNYPSGASPYGAYDMAGNVSEWVADWYDENYYEISPSSNPQGPTSSLGQYRVQRGDSYNGGNLSVRSAGRYLHPSDGYSSDSGFRCAMDASTEWAEVSQSVNTNTPSITPSLTPNPDILNPQGTPISVWKEIPIMPQAITGQEFDDGNTYSFKVVATVLDVRDYYSEKLFELGWEKTFEIPPESDGTILSFEKDGKVVVFTIFLSDASVIVVLSDV